VDVVPGQDALATGMVENSNAILASAKPAHNPQKLLLDSWVVELAMSYNPNFVILSFSKPLFFRGLKNELRTSDNIEA